MLAAAKQSTLSPEQRQITAFFGGFSQPGPSKKAPSRSDAEPIDLDPDTNGDQINKRDNGVEDKARE